MGAKKTQICIVVALNFIFTLRTYSHSLKEPPWIGSENFAIEKHEETLNMPKTIFNFESNAQEEIRFKNFYSKNFSDENKEDRKKEFSSNQHSSFSANHKEITIDWESVDGAIKYLVQIKDSNETLIVNKEVNENRISFPARPGKYYARVGAYNIFQKIGTWSDWTEITVATKQSSEIHPSFEQKHHGYNFSVGYVYSQIISSLHDMYESSNMGFVMRGSYCVNEISALAAIPIIKDIQIEMEFSRRRFDGADVQQKFDSSLELQMMCVNVAYVSNFQIPVNYALRISSGVVRTVQSIKILNPLEVSQFPPTLTTVDPCYQISLSVVVNLGSTFFLDAGASLVYVDYLSENMKAGSLFCLLGIHM
ncbi:MAG: hypothetical protein N2316_11080 [Spirochaetes bacterium]|nr:hypothetical protein [Spirochaetota bacterium]